MKNLEEISSFFEKSDAPEPVKATVEKSGKKSPAPFRLTKEWGLALRIAGFLLVGAGYICGYLYREAYFSRFQRDTGLFPKATPEYFVYGGFAAYQAASALLGIQGVSVGRVLLIIIVTSVGLGVYVGGVAFVVERISKAATRSRRVGVIAQRASDWISEQFKRQSAAKVGVTGASVVLLAFYVVVASCIFIVLLYTIPVLIANAAADRAYTIQLARFGNGCEDEKAVAFCFEVRNADKAIAQGFIIASTIDDVALSDDGRSRVVSLQGRELVQLDMPTKRRHAIESNPQ
jgi:hypothetical protein